MSETRYMWSHFSWPGIWTKHLVTGYWLRTDDRLSQSTTYAWNWPNTHCHVHSVVSEAAIKGHNIVPTTDLSMQQQRRRDGQRQYVTIFSVQILFSPTAAAAANTWSWTSIWYEGQEVDVLCNANTTEFIPGPFFHSREFGNVHIHARHSRVPGNDVYCHTTSAVVLWKPYNRLQNAPFAPWTLMFI